MSLRSSRDNVGRLARRAASRCHRLFVDSMESILANARLTSTLEHWTPRLPSTSSGISDCGM
jgi:hypothetical protein